MNDFPRQKLREIILQYGRSLCDDPRRCEALLRDFRGQYRKEVSVLVSALKERVAEDLLASPHSVPSAILLARLTKRLQDNLGLTQEAARWAVESWGLALGVISEAELTSVDSSSPPQVPPQYRQENINQTPVASNHPSSISQRTEISLKSERGIDYTKLRDLLAAGKWQEADWETARVMCQASGRGINVPELEIGDIDIDNFPCEDLRTINQLWLQYSNGKFGFSVQKEIYQSLGGGKKCNYKIWMKFLRQVGWKQSKNIKLLRGYFPKSGLISTPVYYAIPWFLLMVLNLVFEIYAITVDSWLLILFSVLILFFFTIPVLVCVIGKQQKAKLSSIVQRLVSCSI